MQPLNSLQEDVKNLHAEVIKIWEDTLTEKKLSHGNNMRTLALLKVIAGETVRADPSSKARMHEHLDHLLLIHGDDETFCNGIKEAVQLVTAA
jgi:hypothetical protein